MHLFQSKDYYPPAAAAIQRGVTVASAADVTILAVGCMSLVIPACFPVHLLLVLLFCGMCVAPEALDM